MFKCENCDSMFRKPEILYDSIPLYNPDGGWVDDKKVTYNTCPECGSGYFCCYDDDDEEEKDFNFFRAIVNGTIIAIAFFISLIIINFVVSGLLWAIITRGL
jgi:hypothetical protein